MDDGWIWCHLVTVTGQTLLTGRKNGEPSMGWRAHRLFNHAVPLSVLPVVTPLRLAATSLLLSSMHKAGLP